MTCSVNYVVDKASVHETGDPDGNYKKFTVFVDVTIDCGNGDVESRRILVPVDEVESNVRELASFIIGQKEALAAAVADLPDEPVAFEL